jgi:hypothetical protein
MSRGERVLEPYEIAALRARRARRRVVAGLVVGLAAVALVPVAVSFGLDARSPARRYAKLASQAAGLEGREAAELWRRAAEIAPGLAHPRFQLARALQAAGDVRGAAAAVAEALRLEPDHLEASLLAAEFAVGDGETERARAICERARRRADALYDRRIAARLRFLEGRLAEAAQDRPAAAAAYESAVAIWGRELDARIALARLAEARGDAAAARAVLADAAEAAPAKAAPWLARAALEERRGERGAAIEAAREGARRAPRSREAHLALGELLARAGDAGGAAAEADALLGLHAVAEEAFVRALLVPDAAAGAALGEAEELATREAPPALALLARAALLRARLEAAGGEADRARLELRRAIEAASGVPGETTATDARRALARLELGAGRPEDARREARTLLELDFDDGGARALYFAASLAGGRGADAARDLVAIAGRAGALGLADAALRARRLAEAATATARPSTAEAVMASCEAIRALETTVAAEPGAASVVRIRDGFAVRLGVDVAPPPGFARTVLGDREPAGVLAAAQAALGAKPRDAVLFAEAAAAAEALGRHAEALAAARRAAALAPGDGAAHALLAELIAAGPRPNVALAALESEIAARAAPSDPRVRSLEGALLLRAGRAADAVVALDAAAALTPRDARIHALLGEGLLALGEGARACDEIFAALLLTPPEQDRAPLFAMLAEVRALAAPGREAAAGAPLEPGGRASGSLDAGRSRIHEVRPGAARLLRLVFEGPRDCPSLLDLLAREGAASVLEKRVEVAPGERVAIDGLEPRIGLAVRITARGGAGAYAIGLEGSREDPATFEREPDDDLAHAVPLDPGAPRRGTISPRGDVDCFRLGALPDGEVGTLEIEAPHGIPLDVRLVREGAGGLATVRDTTVGAGERAALERLDPAGDRLFALVSSPGASEEAYSLSWRGEPQERAAGSSGPLAEVEPNDRPEWANAIPCGREMRGAIDRAGDVDWFRLDRRGRGPEELYALSVTASAAVAVALVAEEGTRLRTILAATVAPGAPLDLPRLALPHGGDALVCVSAAPSSAESGARYAIVFGPATDLDPEAEIEPNDEPRAAMPLALGAPRRGRLEPAGDADWYRLAPCDGPVAVTVSGAADVERRLEIYARAMDGSLAPVLGVEVERGAPLAIESLAVPRAELLICLSAREASRETYRLRVDRAAPREGTPGETEPNDDGGDLALRLGPGEAAVGRINWRGDRDPYAVTLGAEPATISLTAPPDAPVDLEIYARDRSGALARVAKGHAEPGAVATYGPLAGRAAVLAVVSGPRTTAGFYRIEVRP